MADQKESDDEADSPGSLGAFDRRDLMKGGGLIAGISGVLWVVRDDTSQSSRPQPLSRPEQRLADLADRIDETDMADPLRVQSLREDIATTVASARESREQQVTSDGRGAADQNDSFAEAVNYYTDFLDILEQSNAIRERLAESETTVLNHKRSLGYRPEQQYGTEVAAFRGSIAQFAEETINSDTDSSRRARLIPDHDRVVTSLRDQAAAYEQHVVAQETYYETALKTEAGVRAKEESQLDEARSTLDEARRALEAGTPSGDLGYRVTKDGLRLGQYAALFTERRDGVLKFIESCDPSRPEEERRSLSAEGVDKVLEARRVIVG
jgi:hypothetical protein